MCRTLHESIRILQRILIMLNYSTRHHKVASLRNTASNSERAVQCFAEPLFLKKFWQFRVTVTKESHELLKFFHIQTWRYRPQTDWSRWVQKNLKNCQIKMDFQVHLMLGYQRSCLQFRFSTCRVFLHKNKEVILELPRSTIVVTRIFWLK